jgi:hypothetical protein
MSLEGQYSNLVIESRAEVHQKRDASHSEHGYSGDRISAHSVTNTRCQIVYRWELTEKVRWTVDWSMVPQVKIDVFPMGIGENLWVETSRGDGLEDSRSGELRVCAPETANDAHHVGGSISSNIRESSDAGFVIPLDALEPSNRVKTNHAPIVDRLVTIAARKDEILGGPAVAFI